jgi:hypothetical protein
VCAGVAPKAAKEAEVVESTCAQQEEKRQRDEEVLAECPKEGKA